MDKTGTSAINTGAYNITVYSGWNGTTSTTDIGDHTLTVSGVATISNASYDMTTGNLVITGANMSANASTSKADIFPKYISITDSKQNSYTLKTTSVVKLTSPSSVTITLNDKDKTALQAFINKNGTSTTGNNAYTPLKPMQAGMVQVHQLSYLHMLLPCQTI